jgi:hypothetical protein
MGEREPVCETVPDREGQNEIEGRALSEDCADADNAALPEIVEVDVVQTDRDGEIVRVIGAVKVGVECDENEIVDSALNVSVAKELGDTVGGALNVSVAKALGDIVCPADSVNVASADLDIVVIGETDGDPDTDTDDDNVDDTEGDTEELEVVLKVAQSVVLADLTEDIVPEGDNDGEFEELEQTVTDNDPLPETDGVEDEVPLTLSLPHMVLVIEREPLPDAEKDEVLEA